MGGGTPGVCVKARSTTGTAAETPPPSRVPPGVFRNRVPSDGELNLLGTGVGFGVSRAQFVVEAKIGF